MCKLYEILERIWQKSRRKVNPMELLKIYYILRRKFAVLFFERFINDICTYIIRKRFILMKMDCHIVG